MEECCCFPGEFALFEAQIDNASLRHAWTRWSQARCLWYQNVPWFWCAQIGRCKLVPHPRGLGNLFIVLNSVLLYGDYKVLHSLWGNGLNSQSDASVQAGLDANRLMVPQVFLVAEDDVDVLSRLLLLIHVGCRAYGFILVYLLHIVVDVQGTRGSSLSLHVTMCVQYWSVGFSPICNLFN